MSSVREHLLNEYGHINNHAELKYNVLLGVFGIHWWGGTKEIAEIKEFLEEMVEVCEREIINMENDYA